MNNTKHATWGTTGALGSAAAIAAQMLCCLPFATGIVGSSVAAIAARIAPAQPYLAAASLLSLTYAFYQVYRPRHSRPACEVSASCTSSVAAPAFFSKSIIGPSLDSSAI